MRNTKTLVWLDLSSNQLTEIPKEIRELRKLSHLNLSNNQLNRLPRTVHRMTQLTTLNLEGNPLSQEYIHQLKRDLPQTSIIF